LASPAQLAEGKSLVKPAVVSDDDNEAYLLEQEYTGLIEDAIWEMLECYLNLPEILHPD
jgi:hypothetical protein